MRSATKAGLSLLAVAGVALTLAFTIGGNGAGASPAVLYEVDDGVSWTLTATPSKTVMPLESDTYGDAGVVVDLGPASEFTGLTYDGSNLTANIWLGDGNQAYTPGTHPLANGVNFSYGPYGGVFWTGTQAGNPVTANYISTLDDTEVYAWVGIVYGGTDVTGYVTSINGHSTGNRQFSITTTGGVAVR